MTKQKINSNKKQNENFKMKSKKNKSKKKNDAKKFKKKDVGKRGRVIVRNLPFSCTEENLAEGFGEFGKIVEISLPKHPDNKPKGFGFIDFQSRLSADKASLALSGKEFLGRTIYVERAVSKERFLNSDNTNHVFAEEPKQKSKIDKSIDDELDDGSYFGDQYKNVAMGQEDDESGYALKNIKMEPTSSEEPFVNGDNKDNVKPDSAFSEQKPPKTPYEIPKKKKARIIIRNLSFKTTEEKLKKHFSSFGDIIDLNLLRRIDNKLVGCAFIEYCNRRSAVKAIVTASGKPFLGRTIVVDWAIPVKDFRKVNKENQNNGDVMVKEEILSDDESSSSNVKQNVERLYEDQIKEEQVSSEEDDVLVKEELEDSFDTDEDDEVGSGTEESDEECEDDYDDDDSGDKRGKKRKLDKPLEIEQNKKPHFESHDVNEGRTVFIKNVPFSATNDDLKDCVKQFGPVFYALICIDPITEHSRGTAFVKYKSKEDAEKCLSAGTSFTLHGSVLDPHVAIDRNKIKEMRDKNKDKNKDSRNLYLIKEGVVLAGTPAANGVSMADMSRRLQLEQLKTQMLKNLNMFVSRNRLIIHNLPSTYDDRKLRKLFLKYSRPNAIIEESRVMRDLKNVDGKGIGKSKEYGFVSFKNHEDALIALRNVNNNPSIFTESKRPIVAFSIENKRILNLKKKRLEKSKINNPLCKNYQQRKKTEENVKDISNDSKGKNAMKKNWKKSKRDDNAVVNNINPKDQTFIGFAAKPGTAGLRSKYKLKVQAKLHHKNVNNIKKDKKKLIKMKPIKSIGKDPGEKNFKAKKRKSIDEDAHFSSLVNKYKTQLISNNDRKKWYE